MTSSPAACAIPLSDSGPQPRTWSAPQARARTIIRTMRTRFLLLVLLLFTASPGGFAAGAATSAVGVTTSAAASMMPAGSSDSRTSAVPGGAITFALPVPGPAEVLTPFRPPTTAYGTGHRGVDLAAPAGAQVRAAGSGTVVYAGDLAGRGVVSIQHPGGLRTTYEPVTATVTRGQAVTAGTVIGTLQVGHPSCAPAVCLHWGARLPDGTYLDPMALLRPWQVRLKPWDGSG